MNVLKVHGRSDKESDLELNKSPLSEDDLRCERRFKKVEKVSDFWDQHDLIKDVGVEDEKEGKVNRCITTVITG